MMDYPEDSIYAYHLAGLTEHLAQVLKQPVESVRPVAAVVVEWLRGTHAGEKVYFPGYKNNSDRNREIYESFNGCNMKELECRYGMRERRLYQIIETYRKELQSSRKITSIKN